MNGKKTFYTEAAYVVGLITLAFGTALMERADFGMSMIVAPAYLVHLKLSQIFPWFTFGTAEYCLQAVLLIATAILWRRFKPLYLFSLLTAVIYGFVLDFMLNIAAYLPMPGMAGRTVFFILGMCFGAFGVSMFFHTYFAPEAYELLVKEITEKFKTDITKTKTAYDCISCIVSILMSFAFFGFGHFEGIKWGTIITALLNGWLIGRWSALTEKNFSFSDGLSLRKYFE